MRPNETWNRTFHVAAWKGTWKPTSKIPLRHISPSKVHLCLMQRNSMRPIQPLPLENTITYRTLDHVSLSSATTESSIPKHNTLQVKPDLPISNENNNTSQEPNSPVWLRSLHQIRSSPVKNQELHVLCLPLPRPTGRLDHTEYRPGSSRPATTHDRLPVLPATPVIEDATSHLNSAAV